MNLPVNDERSEVWEFLIATTMSTLKISRYAAELRVHALRKSGLLERFNSPDDPLFQYTVDVAMKIPQEAEKQHHN